MTIHPEQLAALCDLSMPHESLTTAELTHLCFGESDEVLGDPGGAIAITSKRAGSRVAAWVLLVAVPPDRQGCGVGKKLVGQAIDRARALGATSLHLGNAAPRYVWPGVDLANTRANMLFESFGFVRDLVGVNMTISTAFRHDPPHGYAIERETGDGAVEFATRKYPHWIPELEVAIENGGAFAARDPLGATVGFGCHSCNRNTWIGPMATDPDLQRGGVGSAILAAVCADLDRRGFATGEISWISNFRFYGKCGATVSRVYQGGSLRL